MKAEVGATGPAAWVIPIVSGVIVITVILCGFRECDHRGRERAGLQRIYVERCQGTPNAAERLYPYPDVKNGD